MPQEQMTDELEELVAEATELTGAAPPDLLDEDAPVLVDDALLAPADESVYLVGIIGGKDVGKSSLVNALAGQQITAPTSHGPGTERAIAYAHRDAATEVRALLERELPGRYRVVTHDSAALRRQVLLDLPDVDSHWTDHVLVTRRMLRHILFPVWIQSIEKYADLAPQQLLAKVAEGNDPANFAFVLNKIDQLAGRDGGGAPLNELRDDFARRIARTLGMSQPPRVYAISATHPDQADLPALRQLLAREKSGEAVRRSQQLALRRKDRSLLAWIQRQGLTERAQVLERLERDAHETLAARLGVPLLERALPRLGDDPGHRLAMVEPALHTRLSRWPLVNVIDSVLAPLFTLVRRNLSATSGASTVRALDVYLEQDARTVASLVQSAFAQLQQTHPLVGHLYHHHKLWEELPAEGAAAELRQRLAAAVDRQRDAIMERVAGKSARWTAPFRWVLTIGALLWFPFAQPLLEAFLAGSAAGTTRELLYLAVQMLGVTYLLKNVTFLLIWFAVLWLILRWGTHRKASRLLQRWTHSARIDEPLSLSGQVIQWMDDLLEPIRRHRERVESVVRRADQLRASMSRAEAA